MRVLILAMPLIPMIVLISTSLACGSASDVATVPALSASESPTLDQSSAIPAQAAEPGTSPKNPVPKPKAG